MGGGGSDALMVRRYGKVEVEALAKRVRASDRTKEVKVGTRRPIRVTSFLTNQGDPVNDRRVRDWEASSLHLFVMDKRDHQAGTA